MTRSGRATPTRAWAAMFGVVTVFVFIAVSFGGGPPHASGAIAAKATAGSASGAPRARILDRRLILGPDRRVQMRIACSVAAGCHGRLTIRARAARRGSPDTTYGAGRFRLEGRRGTASVRLDRSVERKLQRRSEVRAQGLARTKGASGRSRTTRRKLRIVPGSPTPPSPTPALHKIKADALRLYDSVTGETFVPRGANYVRLHASAGGGSYHSTFEPGLYDPTAARAALDRMRADGYNTVRVMIDPGVPEGEPHGIGRGVTTSEPFYAPYLDNVADFATAASERGIYVLPSLDAFPQNDYYWDIVAATNGPTGTPNMAGRNLSYLDKGRVAAKAEYMKQFSSGLVERLGSSQTTAILAYQSDNEVFFEANKAPYDKLSGTVTPLNGVTYDMSDPDDRQQSADASLVEYSHRIKRSLAETDPEALLTVGFFTNEAVGKARFDGLMTYCSTSCTPGVDYRVPGRAASLSIFGAADFIDVHVYPKADPWDAQTSLKSIETSLFKRPYVIGEFGARKSVYGGQIAAAAASMRDAQVATCALGAQGWLYWTWDTYEQLASQELFFHMDESGGAIDAQLAPVARPDPCA